VLTAATPTPRVTRRNALPAKGTRRWPGEGENRRGTELTARRHHREDLLGGSAWAASDPAASPFGKTRWQRTGTVARRTSPGVHVVASIEEGQRLRGALQSDRPAGEAPRRMAGWAGSPPRSADVVDDRVMDGHPVEPPPKRPRLLRPQRGRDPVPHRQETVLADELPLGIAVRVGEAKGGG